MPPSTVLPVPSLRNANLVDVSETGVGLLVEQEVEPGTPLPIEVGGHVLLTAVVHCRPVLERHFQLGLLIVQHISGGDWIADVQKWQADPAELRRALVRETE